MKIAVLLLLTGVFACVSGCYPLCPDGCFVYVGKTDAVPVLQMWKKEGVISSKRRHDSRECGSTLKEDVPEPDGQTFFDENGKISGQRSDEDIWSAYDRARNEWKQCMLDKGYRFEPPATRQ